MKAENSKEMAVREPIRSRTDMVLDSSIAMALACTGRYTCSDMTETEEDKLDKLEELCRIRTAETCDTKSWNEYMPRPLLDDEDSILSLESCTGSIFDDVVSHNNHVLGGSEKAEEDESLPGRTAQSEVFLQHSIQREETKSHWRPLLKNKLVKIIRKYNPIEGHRYKQLSSEKLPRSSILTNVALRLRSTEQESNPSNIESPTIRHKKNQAKPRMSSPFGEPLNCNRVVTTLAGFEVCRVATNYVSIIDHSLLLPNKGIPTSMVDNKNALKPKMLNAFSIRTFETSFFGNHLMMPSIHRSNTGSEKSVVSISPKPVSFIDVFDEAGRNNTLRSQAEDSPTEKTLEDGLPNDVVVMKEMVGNGNNNVEIMFKVRAPYRMRRNIPDQEC